MVNYLPVVHFVQVVLKLFAAVQANDVALAVRLARLGDRRCGMAGCCARICCQIRECAFLQALPPLLGSSAVMVRVFHRRTWGPDPPYATPTAAVASNRSTTLASLPAYC